MPEPGIADIASIPMGVLTEQAILNRIHHELTTPELIRDRQDIVVSIIYPHIINAPSKENIDLLWQASKCWALEAGGLPWHVVDIQATVTTFKDRLEVEHKLLIFLEVVTLATLALER